MKALASRLAPFVSPVDFIALYGELGAGKTTFAQGLLPALGVEEAATSPTYQLVHAHAAPRHAVYHCDFYRLRPGEEEEIGFRELCETGAVLAEWPGAIERTLPPDRLEARIEGDGSSRSVALAGFGAWEKKLARFREAEAFLDEHGWSGARCIGVRGDASARLFSRLRRGARNRHAHGLAAFERRPADPRWPPLLRDRASRAQGRVRSSPSPIGCAARRGSARPPSPPSTSSAAFISSRIWATRFSAR